MLGSWREELGRCGIFRFNLLPKNKNKKYQVMSSRLTTVDRSEAANVDLTVKNSKRRREAMVVMETATGYQSTVGCADYGLGENVPV